MKMLIAACSVALCLQAQAFAQEKEAARPFPSIGKGPVQTGGPVIHSQEPALIQREPKVGPRPVRGHMVPDQEAGPVGPRLPKLIGDVRRVSEHSAPDRPECAGKVAEEDMVAADARGAWGQRELPAQPKSLKRPTIQQQPQLPAPLPAPPVTSPNTRGVPGAYNGPFAVPNQGAWYQGFYYNRFFISQQFFAYRNWGPTQYFYFASAGYWWSPTFGYSWQAPVAQGVITIAVVEVINVPVRNPWTGQWVLVQRAGVWYYNAYWFGNLNCWIYQDFRGVYHAVRF